MQGDESRCNHNSFANAASFPEKEAPGFSKYRGGLFAGKKHKSDSTMFPGTHGVVTKQWPSVVPDDRLTH